MTERCSLLPEIGLSRGDPTVDATQADQEELLALGPCQHYWVLDPPEGPVSKGTCRSCGEEREFPNYIQGRFNNGRRKP